MKQALSLYDSSLLHAIICHILLTARIFPRPCGDRKNTAQLAKYPHVLYAKPSNKVYIFIYTIRDCSVQQEKPSPGVSKCNHPSCLNYLSVFKARPSQLHLHLHQRETTNCKSKSRICNICIHFSFIAPVEGLCCKPKYGEI